MPLYQILGSRQIDYEFEIEADSEEEARKEIERMEIHEDVEEYAYEWYPINITNIEEVEDKD